MTHWDLLDSSGRPDVQIVTRGKCSFQKFVPMTTSVSTVAVGRKQLDIVHSYMLTLSFRTLSVNAACCSKSVTGLFSIYRCTSLPRRCGKQNFDNDTRRTLWRDRLVFMLSGAETIGRVGLRILTLIHRNNGTPTPYGGTNANPPTEQFAGDAMTCTTSVAGPRHRRHLLRQIAAHSTVATTTNATGP